MSQDTHWLHLGGRDLRGANLSGVDFRWSDFESADLTGALLTGCNLRWTVMRGAKLRSAHLDGADLRGADLNGADLAGANLAGAQLNWSDLCQTDLSRTDLSGASISGTVLDPRRRCPDATAALVAAGIPVRDGVAYGWRTRESQHIRPNRYAPGRYTAPWFSTCADTGCHPGVYFGAKEWLRSVLGDEVDLVPCAAPVKSVLAAPGPQFRARELLVVEDADWRWS